MEVAHQTPGLDKPPSTEQDQPKSVEDNTKAMASAAAGTANPFDANATRKLSVLLVEDDHATLVFVQALLKSCGHSGERRVVTRHMGDPGLFSAFSLPSLVLAGRSFG